jgi:hypothetical protein
MQLQGEKVNNCLVKDVPPDLWAMHAEGLRMTASLLRPELRASATTTHLEDVSTGIKLLYIACLGDSFGRCILCEHNTEGRQCESCKRGYYGDATRYDLV